MAYFGSLYLLVHLNALRSGIGSLPGPEIDAIAPVGPRILLIAPYSGYAAAAAVGLVLALLRSGEVWVTDWVDARLVPAAAGGFGLADQLRLARPEQYLAAVARQSLRLGDAVRCHYGAAVQQGRFQVHSLQEYQAVLRDDERSEVQA